MLHRTHTLGTDWRPKLPVIAILFASICPGAQGQETRPVGKTAEDQKRNAALLDGYQYASYVEALTGYTGQDRQRIGFMQYQSAVRTRVGPRGNYKAGMALLADGKLVLATCRNEKHSSRQFVIHVYQSADQGLTWEEIGKSPLFGKEPSLTALPGGSLILTAQKMGEPWEIYVSRSSDGGRTWETAMLPGQDYPRNLIVEPDGSALMIRALESGWAGKGSPHLQLGRSKDAGKTWQFSEGLIDWQYAAFGEVAALRLKNGRLLAALRRQIPGTHGEGFEDTVLTESSDGGKHWSKPRQMVNTAEVHVYLTEIHDGTILATYSNYHLPWGVYAILSKDGGKTWDLDRPIELALSAMYHVGWPVTLQLADRSLITCYALEAYWKQDPDTVVTEVVRWRLPGN
jgi:photosystem II stability/assembly factor-like uncharacterized protein